VRKFQEKIGPEQVYNANVSGLFWRLLPTETEENAVWGKMSKDRIMFMPCSNANGTQKHKMLVIGKVAKPRALRTKVFQSYTKANTIIG
jgi:hypothetical protein